MAATEAGYATHCKGVSEAVQAKYIPRLCCEYFRLGFRRTGISYIQAYTYTDNINCRLTECGL